MPNSKQVTTQDNNARVEHSAAIAQYASMKNVDTDRAGKLFRSRLRANFAKIAEHDGEHYGPDGTVKTIANDGRPWGSHSRDVLVSLGLAPKDAE